jgi:plasmid stability protein
MKRTLVQFDDDTYRKLRQRAFRQERSISALVRELVAQGLDGGAARARLTRVDQLQSVRAGRSKQGRLAPVSEKHDEALAGALKT